VGRQGSMGRARKKGSMTTPTCQTCGAHDHRSDGLEDCMRYAVRRVAALESALAKPPGKPTEALVPINSDWCRLPWLGATPPWIEFKRGDSWRCTSRGCGAPARYAKRESYEGACDSHAAEMGVLGPSSEPTPLCGDGTTAAPPAPAESPPSYGHGRCEVCGWPLAESREGGCVPGNCSYRPRDGSPEHRRIRERREVLGMDKLPPVAAPAESSGDGAVPLTVRIDPVTNEPLFEPTPPAPAAPSAEEKTWPAGEYRRLQFGTEAKACEPGCDSALPDGLPPRWYRWVPGKGMRQFCSQECRDAGRPMRPATSDRAKLDELAAERKTLGQEISKRMAKMRANAAPPEPQPAVDRLRACAPDCLCDHCIDVGEPGVDLDAPMPVEPQSAAAPAPECAGPFVDARDCPVHDPRKAAAPTPVTSEEAQEAVTRMWLCCRDDVPTNVLRRYIAARESVEAALRKNVATQRDLVFRHAKDAGESEAGRYKALAECDALRAELARLRDERYEVIAREKHDAPVWDRLEKIALQLEAGHLAVEAKAKQAVKAPAGTGANRERACAYLDNRGLSACGRQKFTGEHAKRCDDLTGLLDDVDRDAFARGREAALPEVAAWRALDAEDRAFALRQIRSAEIQLGADCCGTARRVLEALCEAPKKGEGTL